MNRRTCPVLGISLLLYLFGAAPVAAQEGLLRVPPTGFQTFLNLLYFEKLKPLPDVRALAKAEPSETLIVVFGDLRGLDPILRAVGGFDNYRRNGGAILVATDRNDQGRLAELGLAVHGGAVEVMPEFLDDPKIAYRRVSVCPVIDDWLRGHPIFRGMKETPLATNEPTKFVPHEDCTLHPLAPFPHGCWLSQTREAVDGQPYVVGTLGRPQEGRVLLIAGHGMFMNHMLARQDNDNFTFAWNCVDWLSEGGKRKHALFVENGSIAAKFDVDLAQLPELSPKLINGILRELEEKNFFNRLLLENAGREQLLRGLVVMLTLALAVFALHRLVRAQHGHEPGPPSIAVAATGESSDLPVLVQRQRHQLDQRNYFEAARELARLCFEEHPHAARPTAPLQVVRGGRRLQRQIEELWLLAYGEEARPIGPTEFAGLATTVAQVRAALASEKSHKTNPKPQRSTNTQSSSSK